MGGMAAAEGGTGGEKLNREGGKKGRRMRWRNGAMRWARAGGNGAALGTCPMNGFLGKMWKYEGFIESFICNLLIMSGTSLSTKRFEYGISYLV